MLNNVTLQGRMTADPELRQTPSGVPVLAFTLAVQRSYVKKGEPRQTDFIDCVAWRGDADFICKFFRKGSEMNVTGALQVREYTDKQNNKRKLSEVHLSQAHFCGPKNIDIQPLESDKSAFEAVEDDTDLPF